MQGLRGLNSTHSNMAELGFQSLTPDDATIDSSNCDGRAGREKFLRGMTEEESGESGIVFYEPWFNPDTAQPPNETPSNKSEMADSPGPPKQGAEEADLLSKSGETCPILPCLH